MDVIKINITFIETLRLDEHILLIHGLIKNWALFENKLLKIKMKTLIDILKYYV